MKYRTIDKLLERSSNVCEKVTWQLLAECNYIKECKLTSKGRGTFELRTKRRVDAGNTDTQVIPTPLLFLARLAYRRWNVFSWFAKCLEPSLCIWKCFSQSLRQLLKSYANFVKSSKQLCQYFIAWYKINTSHFMIV